MNKSTPFYYFAFGSNLLKQRMELNNYSFLKFQTIAKLKDYKLTFNYNSKRWNGAVATIVPSPGSHVWGVVWQMDSKDVAILNDQESVSEGVYEPFEVNVLTPNSEVLRCRTYRLLKESFGDRRPSMTYKNVILKGAVQSQLPEDYIENLKLIEHNGLRASNNLNSLE